MSEWDGFQELSVSWRTKKSFREVPQSLDDFFPYKNDNEVGMSQVLQACKAAEANL